MRRIRDANARRWWVMLALRLLQLLLLSAIARGNLFSPEDVPGPPEKVLVTSRGDAAMRVQFLPPVRTKAEGNNGAPVLGYKVEVAQRVNDVQTFTVEANGPVSAGSYKMTFTNAKGNETTACVPWNATEIVFETALEELLIVDSVSVTRSPYGAVRFGYVYTIEFDGKLLVSGAQPNVLVADQIGCAATKPLNRVLTFSGAHVTTGVKGYQPEIWEVVTDVTSGNGVVGGAFDLSVGFHGDWKDSLVTATIVAGSRVATTIPSMSMVGKVNRGDAVKIGGEEFTVHMTAPFTDTQLPLDSYHVRGTVGAVPVFLRDTALGDVAVSHNSASVSTSSDFTALIAAGEHIKIGRWEFKVFSITTSTLTLDRITTAGNNQWPDAPRQHITAYKRKKVTINAAADARDVQKALVALPGVGIVHVSRVGPTKCNGYRWRVTFESLGGSSNKCPESPCLRADAAMGTTVQLADLFGGDCAMCVVTASLLTDESNTALVGIDGEYQSTSVVASEEIGGTIDEVQTIAVIATADDVRGSFAINFQNTFVQSPGATINYDDTAADVRTKLQNLPTVGRLNVSQSENSQFGYTWTITFLSNMGDQPLFLVDKSGLTGTGVDVVVEEREKGVDTPFEAIVEGLSSSRDYYIRAFARNENGYGSGTDLLQSIGKGALPLTTQIATAPASVKITSTWPVSGSEIGFHFTPPDAHGSPIRKYLVDYAIDTTFGVVPIKKLAIFNPLENDVVGTFRLQYGDDFTPLLSIHTSAEAMVDALSHLPSLRPVQVSRAPYVLTGTSTSRVKAFVATTNMLSTTPLTAQQCRLLASGTSLRVGSANVASFNSFVVKTQPVVGATTIEVQSGHGVADFTADRLIVVVDAQGTLGGASGYEWTITFTNEVDQIRHGTYPGLQLISTLRSVEAGSLLASFGLMDIQVATPTDHYGFIELSNDRAVCDSYVVGAPSADQVLQLFASTTVTQRNFRLQLGAEVTPCITLGTTARKSDLEAALRGLAYVPGVSVDEQRNFKVSVLTGSSASAVTDYVGVSGTITVTSLTAPQAAVLLVNTIIQVSRNPNDFSRHSCELIVTTAATALATSVAVVVAAGTSCADFGGETRSLKVLDLHDYKIRFRGQYPTGQWPTLKVVPTPYADGTTCTTWAPAIPVYTKIHTVKYEGACANGQRGSQTILVDALNAIGGYFTLSYRGRETTALPFLTTTASAMRDAIESITRPGTVNVTLSQYGSYGKAWRVTFMSDNDGEDLVFIKHSFLTGQDAVISVYPTIEVSSDAARDDISGTFRLTFGGETTEPIAYTATHAKVTQELQKLSVVDSVVALGGSGDVGVTFLKLTATASYGNFVLTNIQLDLKPIDPTLFLAVREKLTIAGITYSVKSLTPIDITLATTFVGTTGLVTIAAGMLTKQTKPLPGRVSISPLMPIVTATNGTSTFELPSDHGYHAGMGDVFFVNGNRFTVVTVTGAVVTTREPYTGNTIIQGSPLMFLYDNRLRTTSDLSGLLQQDDAIWLQNAVGDMTKYTVASPVQQRYIPVTGVFTEAVVAATALSMGFGRKWTLVFRSYTAELETIDALPQNDWRGTGARLRARHPTAVAPQTVLMGNADVWQTVLLDAPTAYDVGSAATYTLTFGSETTVDIPWGAVDTTIKTKLEALNSVDGVTVTSLPQDNGFVHTIRFWGEYTMAKLPTLVGTVTSAVNANKCAILVRNNGAVAHTKRDHLILKSSQELRLRMVAVNGKGMSDAPELFSLQTATTSVVPTPPTSVVLGEYHGRTWLSLYYRPPIYTGGAAITMYRLEWDSSPTFDSASNDYGVATIQKRFEVQQVTSSYRSNVNQGGSFTLAWGGRVTPPLPFDCSRDQMTDALAVLTDTTNIASKPVSVVQARVPGGYTWTITFSNTPGNLALVVADGTSLTGDFPRLTVTELVEGYADMATGDFTREVQDVYTDASSVLSGSFKLAFEGQVTSVISVDASALEMQDAIQAVTTLYSIKVSRTWRMQAMNTAIWSVTFAYLKGEEMVGAGDIFQLTVDTTALLGTAASVRVATKILGSDPFRYTITGLRPNTRFYMHAMAYNAEGFGSATSPLSTAVTCGQPEPPQSVVASVVDGTTLAVSWTPSETSSANCLVDKYKVEWYRTEGVLEQQTITTSASKGLPEVQSVVDFADSQSLGGFFRLAFGNEVTENIAWDAPAIGLNSVKSRLERLSSVGTVDVTRQPSTRVVGGLMVVASGTTLTSSTIAISDTGLGQGSVIWVLGKQLTIITVTTPTSFTVSAALSTDIAVPVFKTAYGFEWHITFQAGHVGPQDLLTVAPSDSWAGNNPGIYTESIQKGLQPISGSFRVSCASGGLSHITQPLPYNVTARGMQQALENLVTIGLVNVTRSPNGFGFNWLVTFISDVKSDLALLGVDGTELHGPSVRISAAITYAGVQPGYYCEANGAVGAPAIVALPASGPFVIRGLTTGQKYAIRVRAHNSEGYGGAGYLSPTYQIPRTTPSAPSAVKLLVLSSRQLKVQWVAPLSDGGSAITSYKIQWDTTNTFANVDSPTYDRKTELRVLPTDTSPFFYNVALTVPGPFFVRVLAVNDQGPGVPALSDPVAAMAVDRTPGRVENVKATVLSSFAILVEWDPSSPEKPYYGGDGGLPITQYMIEWDSSTAFDSPASFGLVGPAMRSFIIGGNDPVTGVRSTLLTPNTLYSMRVTAFNAKGAGPPQATTPASVIASNQSPTVPRNLQLTVQSATSLQATWANPLYDGGLSLKSYEVQWDELNDFSSGQSAHATIPIVREMQSIAVTTDVVNEEQFIDATVEVINEVQVVRTSFTGADEVQVIQTTNANVRDEVQTVTTSATDRNEVQELRVDADDVNEIQAVRTTVPETFEVQTIQIGATRNAEVQTISMTLPGTDLTKVGGWLSLTFDNTNCTHCSSPRGLRRADGLISALLTTVEIDSAKIIQDALNGLDNIGSGGVTVTCVVTTTTTTVFAFMITFVGDTVAGNVTSLTIDRSITYNSLSVGGLPTIATESTPGAEVVYDTASVFSITHTCESYSAPTEISTFSNACKPPSSALLCASCVTAFNGATFTLAAGTTLASAVALYDRLIAGVCVFEVGATPTATTLTVLATDVGALCSPFSGEIYPLYRATQQSASIPVKMGATNLTVGSVVAGMMNAMTTIDAVLVTRTELVAADFVGSLYDVTFRKRSSMVPLLLCDRSAIQVTSGASVCKVTRTTKGSMITGSFTLSLTKESDSSVTVTTPAIPWDVTGPKLESILGAVVDANELVFGTVKVQRSIYSPTGNKWSGGFTWQIEFTGRDWDVPKMSPTSSLTNAASTLPAAAPTLTVEDGSSPLNPFAGSRHGNMVDGTITIAYGGRTAPPFRIGADTTLAQLHTSIPDTTFQTFLTTNLGTVIPTVEVMRSPATPARGFTWTITFSNPANGGDIPMLTLPLTNLSPPSVRAQMFETVKGNQLGGTFQLQFNNEKTGPILFSADKLAVQAQLNSLASIKPSSVLVDCVGPATTASNQVLSYTWFITFRSSTWADPASDHNGVVGNWKGARAKWDDVWPETGYSKAWGRHVGPMGAKGFLLTCIKDGLSTTANDHSQDCITAVQTPGIGPLKGTFTLSLDTRNVAFMSVKQIVTSLPIAHNAWATKQDSGATGTSVEEILEKMANVGDVAVSRSSVDILTGGYTWTITFLRDANGPCDQEEPTTDGVPLCNAPGDVPAFTKDDTALSGASQAVSVCEASMGTSCFSGIVQNGRLLRGDFTTFQVTNDPGFAQRYELKTSCPHIISTQCGSIDVFTIASGSEDLPLHLLVGDRFTVDTYSSCIFKVTQIGSGLVYVTPLTCNAMLATIANTALSVSLRLPWNADASLVKRALEASSDQANEIGVWAGGRKVSVTRTIHGKYGEVSWQVQFISNPTFTPPGAGNIPAIVTLFVPLPLPLPLALFQTTVTQLTPGSVGLSGSFLVDYRSTLGPRPIAFDETEDRLQRKLNELNTIGRVIVKKLRYPSSATNCLTSACSGGWDDRPVDNPGTRGGYRWRVRFMKVTGEYGGLTFPSGSGNVNPLSVTLGTLGGNARSIDVTTNLPGSPPILGGFVLNTTTTATPVLPYASSADSIKQGLEAMHFFGDVDVTQDVLVTQKIPNAVATLTKDAYLATITGVDDIRQFLAPGDYVRFGPTSATNLGGTNGDSPFSGVLATSMVAVDALSPIVRADPIARRLVYPGMTLRIDGLKYAVRRSGAEIQTLTTAIPAASGTPLVTYFKLSLLRNGVVQTSATCLKYNEESSTIEDDLRTQLVAIITPTAVIAGSLKVTRRGPVSTLSGGVAQTGYVYSIYFLGDAVAGDVATLVVDTSSCTALTGATATVAVVTHGGTIAQQRLSLATDAGQVVDSVGYFTLTFGSVTTPCLPWGLPAADLEVALETRLLTGDVLVARRGSGTSVTEIQRLRLTSNAQVTSPATGLFKLALTIDGKTSWTPNCLAYGVSAEGMQIALNQLATVGAVGMPHVNVTRDGDGSSSWGYGYEYTIAFRGPITGGYSAVLGNMNQVEVLHVGTGPCAPVIGGEPALIVETVRDGSAGFTYDIYFLASTTAYTPKLVMATAACAANPWTHTGGSVRKASMEIVDIGGSAEVQTLTLQDSAVIASTASYKLSLGGFETNCITVGNPPSVLETQLNLLRSIGALGVMVSWDQHPILAPNGFIYKITFVGDRTTGNPPLLGVSAAGCVAFSASAKLTVSEDRAGGFPPNKFVTTALYAGERPNQQHVAYRVAQLFRVMNEQIEVQTITIANPVNDIAVDATYMLVVNTIPTAAIRWDASEATLETLLAVGTLRAGDIVVTRRVDDTTNGFVYTLYFSGAAVAGDVAPLTVATNSLTNFNGGSITIATTVDGVDRIPSFQFNSIPLALASDGSTATSFLGVDASLDVFKVNGFFWTIKFKSTIGNVPALGLQPRGLTGKLSIVDDFIAGSASSAYVMSHLMAGIPYFVRVAAATDAGIGAFTDTASLIPSGLAPPVQNVAAGYALAVQEVQEVRLAATHISEVQAITTSAAKMAEVQTLRTYAAADACFDGNCLKGRIAFRVPTIQTITVSARGPITAGSFAIRFVRKVGDTHGAFTTFGTVYDTGPIAWNAEAKDVLTAMATLDAVDAKDLVVTRDGDASAASGFGYVFSITFVGNSVAGETELITINDVTTTCGLCVAIATTGNVAHAITVGINAGQAMGTDTPVQEVIVKADKPLVAGSYQLVLNYLGAAVTTSACIPFDAAARGIGDLRAMETIVSQMTNIDKVFVTRSVDSIRAPNGFVYRLFFYGNGVIGPLPLLTAVQCVNFQTLANNALSTNVNSNIVISILNAGGFAVGPTFFGDAAAATAAQLETALDRLPVFGDVIATQSLVDQQGGFVWTVAFTDAQGNVPQFICAVDPTFAATIGTACETTTLTDGNALSGSFMIDSSVPIPYDASAAVVQQALQAMAWVGAVQVVRSGPTAQMGFTWMITFLTYMGDVPPLAVTSSLVGTASTITVTEIRKGNSIGGTFTLQYLSSTTDAIAWNAAATRLESGGDGSSLQEKLEALSIIGPLRVTRSVGDYEGGFVWRVTFLDNNLNPGDVPLLQGNAGLLTGVGVVAATREILKGSNAVGDQLWLSFEPPVTDNGSPITTYLVRWDTAASFTASPGEVAIIEAEKLYQLQRVETSAASLAWSQIKPPLVNEVQTVAIVNGAVSLATFTLSFRGVQSAQLTIGTSTAANLLTALSALSSIGSITISPSTGTLVSGSQFAVTFTSKPGNLPLLQSSNLAVATVTETTSGATNYRKQVVVFSCTGTTGDVIFSYGTASPISIAFDATLAIVSTQLHTLFGVPTGSLRVLSTTQLVMCVSSMSADITIVFDRVYGNIALAIAGSAGGPTITLNTAASIDGVYNNQVAKMSGTFQVGYAGAYTRSLNAESTAQDVRYALEDLSTIQTVAVDREPSYQALVGTLDVVNGQIFATCSAGQFCDFKRGSHGLPGHLLRLGRQWYTILSGSTSPDDLETSRLFLGDVNGNEIGYLGETQTGATASEWTKGYIWSVHLLRVDAPLAYLRAKIPRLYPTDAVVKVAGSACRKCYYLPTQTTKKLIIGQEYFIDVTAFNDNGKGQSLSNPIRATPSQVPNAPSNVDVAVVSGRELEVFFFPPALASMNVNPSFNNDIASYVIQWDTKNDFKHGLPVCTSCAVSLTTNVLLVSQSLLPMLSQGTKFTLAMDPCVLQVAAIDPARIDVVGNHGCTNFNGRAFGIYYFTYPPAVLSGLELQAAPPYRFVIANLVVATTYFIRVAATNAVPVQVIALSGNPPDNRKWSFPLSATTKDTVPDPPITVFLYPFSGTTLELQIQPPTRDGKGLGGTAVTYYWIDVDTVATFDSATKPAPLEVDVTSGNLPLLYPGGPRIYYLKDLLNGVQYFVQVKAKNSIGYSRATLAPNPLAPTRSPDGPVNVKVSTVTTSSTPIEAATVTWQPPISNGGLAITSYRIEWWNDVARPEIQVLEIKWTSRPLTAPFKLAFGGGTTGDMPFDVSPENVRSALMNIIVNNVQVIQHVEVAQTTLNSDQGFQWRVTFLGALNAGNQPLIQFEFGTINSGAGVTGRVFEAQSGIAVPQSSFPGKREVQVLMTSFSSTVGGYFRLSYRGSAWSNYLSATIADADLKLALEALPTVGKVSVAAAVPNPSQNGLTWTITFESTVGNLPGLIIDRSKLTPAGAFIGVKDGDNAVTKLGNLCVPGEDICPGTWGAVPNGIAAMATVGEAAVDYNFYETIDASAYTYRITGLQTGKTYYVAVTAKNALGLGVRIKTAPATIIPPVQVPSLPTQVRVDVNPGVATQLTATWAAPMSDGGSDVRMYRIEYDPSPLFRNRGVEDFWCPTAPTYAVWRVQTTRVDTSGKGVGNGYFTLALTRKNKVLKTEPIPWNAVDMASSERGDPAPGLSKVFCTACTACTDRCDSVATFPFNRRELSGALQSKLEFLPTITSVQIQRSVAANDGGFAWTITFQDVGDDFFLEVDTNALTCNDNVCGSTTYSVTTTKVKAGINNAVCTGSKVIPRTGALNKGQLYYVRVFAFNQVGFGLPALMPSPQKPMVVPGPPTGVTLQVLSVSDLKVLFSPPDDNGGDTIIEYSVEWSTNNAFTTVQSGSVLLLAGGAPYYRVLPNLVKGTYYYVRVRARNTQGFGQYQLSSPLSLNPSTTPSAPTKVTMGITSLTMLTVQWYIPDDDGGDVVSGYIVQWDISGAFDSLGADATKVKITDVTQRAYTITLLTPGTVYYVRVFAVNANGPGTAQTTTPTFLTPINTRPGKPHSLEAAPTTTTGELLIKWQMPRIPAHGIPCSGTLLVPWACPVYGDVDVVFGGFSFGNYVVQWSDSAAFTGSNLLPVTTTSALLTALNSGTRYYVRVLTQNVEGGTSDFCARANANLYLCPDNLVLLDGTIVTGAFVSAIPK